MVTSLKGIKANNEKKIEDIASAVSDGSSDSAVLPVKQTSRVASGFKPLPPSPKSIDLD